MRGSYGEREWDEKKGGRNSEGGLGEGNERKEWEEDGRRKGGGGACTTTPNSFINDITTRLWRGTGGGIEGSKEGKWEGNGRRKVGGREEETIQGWDTTIGDRDKQKRSIALNQINIQRRHHSQTLDNINKARQLIHVQMVCWLCIPRAHFSPRRTKQ